MKRALSISLLLFTSFVCLQANANLISNGSFEEFEMGATLPGDFVDGFGVYPGGTGVVGWTGIESIEIHPSGFLGNTSQDGRHHAELRANPAQMGAFVLQQSFDTVVNQLYKVTFWAQKREENDGEFTASAGGTDLAVSTHIIDEWTPFTFLFTASGITSTLGFTAEDGADTVGHLIDNVYVSAVPLPGAIVLLAGGLLGLGAFRKRAVEA